MASDSSMWIILEYTPLVCEGGMRGSLGLWGVVSRRSRREGLLMEIGGMFKYFLMQ